MIHESADMDSSQIAKSEGKVRQVRLPGIEMLRGIAAFLVVVHHTAQQNYPHLETRGHWGRLLEWFGPWGVTVFFVLSGFCIHLSFARAKASGKREFDARDYLRRRALRILPAYFACVIASSLVGLFASSNLITPPTIASILTHLLLVSSFTNHSVAINGVLWTVVVECHFYLLYLPYLALRKRYNLAVTTLITIVASGVTFVFAAIYMGDMPRWIAQHTALPLWWQWCIGAAAAEIYVRRSSVPHLARPIAIPMIAGCLLCLSLGLGVVGTYEDGVQLLRFVLPILATILVICFAEPVIALFSPRPLTRLGDISYSLYLYHPLAVLAVWKLLISQPSATRDVVTVLLSLLLGAAGYFLFEQPFMPKKRPSRNLFSDPRPDTPAAPVPSRVTTS